MVALGTVDGVCISPRHILSCTSAVGLVSLGAVTVGLVTVKVNTYFLKYLLMCELIIYFG